MTNFINITKQVFFALSMIIIILSMALIIHEQKTTNKLLIHLIQKNNLEQYKGKNHENN